jgi:hypothetical protein
LEVDLLDKGIDLLDLYRGKVSMRRVIAVVKHLPHTSAFMQELGKREVGEAVHWGPTEHLMCAMVNSNRSLEYLTAMLLWAKSDQKTPEPKPLDPIYPPGYQPPEEEKPVFTTPDQLAGFFWHANTGFKNIN